MSASTDTIENFVSSDYKYGFTTDIESESLEPGLNEEVIHFISNKKNNSGKITIEYKDLDQFELISNLLTKN